VKSSGFQAGNRSLEAELRKTGNEAVADIYRGFGTHLTPTYEPITIARNLAERESLVQAIASGGAGGLNHDATRVQENEWAWRQPRTGAVMAENRARRPGRVSDRAIWSVANRKAMSVPHPGGRLPGNVIVEHAESCTELQCEPDCIVRDIDAQGRTKYAPGKEQASRFFTRLRYTARTPASERLTIAGVSHPTQKPQALLAWLAALVVKPGDHVLDPFAGSGAIAEAVVSAGASVTSVEIEAAYVEMIRARMAGVGGQDRPPRS
jgi:site-specific DNA-methyltransferase (adenine-specific)